MSKIIFGACVGAAALSVTTTAFAVTVEDISFTYRAFTTYPSSAPRTCTDLVDSTDTGVAAVAECSSADGDLSFMASTGPDGLRASATVTGYSETGDSSGYGSAILFDEMLFSEDSGIFRVGFDISGSLELWSEYAARVGASLDLISYDIDGFSMVHEVFSHDLNYLSHLGVYGETMTGSYGMGYVDIAFTDGYLKLTSRLDTTAGCTLFTGMTECDVSSDFMSTVVFLGGSILDSEGNVVAGATVTSASGIDYLRDASPPPPEVPLPASLPLVLSGFGILSLMRRLLD